MPDISQTDSQRSDTSSAHHHHLLRPRAVSFNRDVHVKRIVPRGEEGRLRATHVRKKPARLAINVPNHVDGVSRENGSGKFNTFPTRRRRATPPKKPPRTFAERGRWLTEEEEDNEAVGANVVVIDVDEATDVGGGGGSSLGRRLKALKKMIHSSQQPVEKLPLTRGRAVGSMVRKLNYDNATATMPNKPAVLVHNGNQPFSYTRATSPIIYAQVVCNGVGGTKKQTVHTSFAPTSCKKQLPHSDSDEGLGYEPFKNGETYFEPEEYPITPKFQANAFNGFVVDSGGGRKDLSARRDQLESRINRRFLTPAKFDGEPKSFDSQASDYRSSPEHHAKSRRHLYTSNPEIRIRADLAYNYDEHRRFQEQRKDKLGDSGIEENDFRRSGKSAGGGGVEPLSNESEDEGFASSLLIASERQHTEDNFATRRRNRRGYESDDALDFRSGVSRERCIDDGSHFDPRIDKIRTTDRKPPKPEKRSGLEKMKQLFTTGRKKKEKQQMVREESLRARYTEYRGDYDPKLRNGADHEYQRRTPPPSAAGSWFKSLDRLSRKKSKKIDNTDEVVKPTKSLRFFGDTDQESTSAESGATPQKSALKTRHRSQSTRDLHNISEEAHRIPTSHKSMLNLHQVAEAPPKSASRISLKPPVSPSRHRTREASKIRYRRKNEVSSVESSTEGDSSQQSQRSVVYLHAAAVGDIPGPGYLRHGRRAASREELSSNRIQPHVKKTLSRSFSVLAPWKPRGRENGVDIDYAQYEVKQPASSKRSGGKYEQFRSGSSRRESSTLKKRTETRRTGQNGGTGGGGMSCSTLGSSRRSRSKENVQCTSLKRGETKSSSSSLYKKRERQPPKESNRYSRYEDRRIAAKCGSVESLGGGTGGGRQKAEVSRSMSMPRDPDKNAGWFSMTKSKSKNKTTMNGGHHR